MTNPNPRRFTPIEQSKGGKTVGKPRGLAALSIERRREIASMGGKKSKRGPIGENQ